MISTVEVSSHSRFYINFAKSDTRTLKHVHEVLKWSPTDMIKTAL